MESLSIFQIVGTAIYLAATVALVVLMIRFRPGRKFPHNGKFINYK